MRPLTWPVHDMLSMALPDIIVLVAQPDGISDEANMIFAMHSFWAVRRLIQENLTSQEMGFPGIPRWWIHQIVVVRRHHDDCAIGPLAHVQRAVHFLGWRWVAPNVFVTLDGTEVDICEIEEQHWEHLVRDALRRALWKQAAARRQDMASSQVLIAKQRKV